MPTNPRDAELDRKLEAWGASRFQAEPSAEIRRNIQGTLASSLTPVKPLASQPRLVFEFLAVLTACAIGLIAIMDIAGFHLLVGMQMALMAMIFAAGGMLFSVILAWQMVPGSRRGFPLSLGLVLLGLEVLGGMALLFPWQTSRAFVSEGWPCAVMELMIAVPAAVVFWLLARRGALLGGAGAGAAVGGLAVVLALTPVQFQCMFQQAPHLLVWHGVTAAILIGLGALIGEFRYYFGQAV
jgi:hypothetical protein